MKHWQKPAIAILTIAFTILILANISTAKVLDSLLSIGWDTVLLCLGLHLMVYLFRCLAIYIFLQKEVPLDYLMATHFIHNFYLNIMPVNMGELSLPLLLSRFVSKTRSFSALFITRIAGVIVMLALFAVSLLYVFHGFGQFNFSLHRLISGIALLAALVAAFFLLSRIKLKSNKLVDYVRELLLKLKSSLLFSWRNELSILNVIFLILITLGYLTFMALFYQLILTRLQVSVSLMQIFYLMSLHMAILILPIRSFGGIGTTEGVWMAGMMTLGIGSTLALESGLIIHIIQLFSATVYFLIGLALKHFLDKKAV